MIFGAAMFTVAQVNPIVNAYKAFNAYNLMLAFFPCSWISPCVADRDTPRVS